MAGERKHTLHRFEIDGRRFAIDPETCFCLECDAVSWAVFEHYPDKSFEEIRHLLGGQFPPREIEEVISEIEWLRAGGSLWPKLTPELLAKRYESTPTELSEIVVFPYEPPPARPMTGGNVQEKSASPVSVPGGWRRWFSGAQNDSALPDCAGNEITAARDLVMAAGNLLLARSGNARNLRLVLSIPSGMDPSLPWADAEPVLRNLVQAARLSDKKLSAGILQEGVAVNGEPCEWHWLLENDTGPEPVAEALKRLPKKKDPKAIAGWMESCETDTDSLHGQVWLTPNRADFSGLVRRWRQWGFRRIILRDAALAADLPAEHLELYVAGMRRNAEDYANDLLKSDLYLCEPFATWFRLIYAGEPSWRGDPAGTGRLAVNGQGTIYPDAEFMSGDASPLGRMGIGGGEAAWDADRASDFLDLGSMTMPSCLGCWARGLCGGGQALVHYRRSGSITRPDPSWCDARRRILEHVIAAFNTLSAAGIPFLDLHRALGRSKGGLSWRLLLRAVRGSVL
ncbi:MAG TPA: hypothetical protein PLX03_09865, partial [Candidatus Hydrogenedentes bacterium]|nr:hypothetical protein [Candidatus Hydrogenedentota bacterium]